MRQFEVCNPSDKATIEADDPVVACVATLLVGRGQLGLLDENGDILLPVFLFGGADEWIAKNIGAEEDSLPQYVDANLEALVAALDSCMYGGAADRKAYQRGLDLVADDPEKREAWRQGWAEDRRTSTSKICAAYWGFAEHLRQRATGEGRV